MSLIFSLYSNAQQLPFAHLNISDGLEDTVIFSIEQDNSGFLWIATRTGINRFDGEHFWTFGRKQGLPHNLSRDLLNSSDGTLWAASEQGLAWFDGNKFQTIKNWPENTAARALSQSLDGTIWVATYGSGIIQVQTGRNPKINQIIKKSDGLPSDRVRSIFIDSEGNIWAGMSNNIVRITNGTIEQIKWHAKKTEIRTFYQHSDMSIWVGTRHGVIRFNGDSFEPLDLGDNVSKQTINTIIQDSTKNIWLGTRDFGVYKIEPSLKITHFDMMDGLPDNSVNSIYQDNENNLWFGTYGAGIARLSTSKVVNWKAQANFTNPNVYSISDDQKGCIWFGTNGSGVSSLCDKTMRHYSKKDGLPHNKILSTMIDTEGTPWFGTLQGLSHLEDGEFINYDQAEGMSGSINYHVIQTTDLSIWIGTNNGLDHFDGKNFTAYNMQDGLPNNRINRILESEQGGLWIASANGLTRFKDDKFINYSSDDGLPANFINDFYEDQYGGLWIATNNGLSYFFANQFKNWTIKDGLPHNNTTTILPGNKDEIWIGTSRGVAIFDGKDFTIITSREGLVFDLVNRGAGYKGDDGNLWFGTGDGISRFASDFKPGSSKAPPVHLLSLSNNQKNMPIGINANIKQQNSSLNFKFTAISFQRSSDVNFRYRLATNTLTRWRETRLRELQINSLAPNNYTFEVTARIAKGDWNTHSSTYQFTVTPPFWKTLWFLGFLIVAILSVFFYRNHRSKQHALKLENTVLERTKQLHDVNKGLKWLANHDNLTHLANRNFIHHKLQQLEFSPSKEKLGILVIDLDHFKRINDQYGHAAGDIALKSFADMLQNSININQTASRWGGEEFLILCPKIDSTKLEDLANAIIVNCRNLEITISQTLTISLNCSIGYAQTPLQNKNSIKELAWEKTLQLADLALYDAKQNGRNCTVGYIWGKLIPDNWSFTKVIEHKNDALKEGILIKATS